MASLYIIGTPIGNMEDITLRAIRVLGEVDVVFAEDTRVTGKLLERHEINTALKRLDANIEGELAEKVTEVFEKYESVALVTDAGTPTISDPGYRFVHAAHEAGVDVVAIPGASALTAALSISGIPSDQFIFLGFLPHKKGRQTLLNEIAEIERTVVLFESPHRIEKLLSELVERCPERSCAIFREITKLHESSYRGTVEELVTQVGKDIPARGEFVVVLGPAKM